MSEKTTGNWPLWEVFVRSSRGLSHVHAGSLHAPDAEMALWQSRLEYAFTHAPAFYDLRARAASVTRAAGS